ncbi:MAG: hypothetical protein KDA75_13700, partial [Planctomycetaceae bacterium]|nr:hypothetical protein [Planctomycetaceae bacterium]
HSFPASEGMGYGEPSPTPMVEISEDATLYTLEEAQRVGIRVKGAEPEVEVCPVCNQVPCVCDEEDNEDPSGGSVPSHFAGEGTPAHAFQAIVDQCHDHDVTSLARLFIRVEGMGKDAARDVRSLGLAIPQIGKAQYQIEQRLILEFEGGEKFQSEFRGSWDRYKRIKSVTDQLSQEASNASVRMVVKADFESGLPLEGDQFQTIRDVLESLAMGKVSVDGQPQKQGATSE